jgi:hypothetical protein
MSVPGGQSGLDDCAPRRLSRTLLGLPGMSPQCPLLGENEKRDARREPASQAGHIGTERKASSIFGQVTS